MFLISSKPRSRGDVKRMTRTPALGYAQALRAFKSRPHRIGSLEQRASVAPGGDERVRFTRDFPDPSVIVRTDGIGLRAQRRRLRRAQGKEVAHQHSAVAPAARERHAAPQGGIISLGIRHGGIQSDKSNYSAIR